MRPAAFWHFDNMGSGLNILEVPRTQTMLTHFVHVVCHWMAARRWASLLAEAVDTWRRASPRSRYWSLPCTRALCDYGRILHNSLTRLSKVASFPPSGLLRQGVGRPRGFSLHASLNVFPLAVGQLGARIQRCGSENAITWSCRQFTMHTTVLTVEVFVLTVIH